MRCFQFMLSSFAFELWLLFTDLPMSERPDKASLLSPLLLDADMLMLIVSAIEEKRRGRRLANVCGDVLDGLRTPNEAKHKD